MEKLIKMEMVHTFSRCSLKEKARVSKIGTVLLATVCIIIIATLPIHSHFKANRIFSHSHLFHPI